MTKKELNELSDLIVNKLLVNFGMKDFEKTEDLLEAGEEVHRKILSDLIMGDTEYFITDEEMLVGELARLQTILMIYEDKEEYEKAAIIHGKLRAIQHKLSGL